MKNEVFNRKEVKYIVSIKEFKILSKAISKHMSLDKFNISNKPYKVNTIYFDTEDNSMVSKSLLKPKYKEKVRLRSYDNFEDSKLCFLEIKKKYNGVGNKRRTKILYKDALDFIKSGVKPELKEYMNAQVLNELEYIIKKERIYPKVSISYDRIAYYSNEDRNLRLTFDKNILAIRDGKNKKLLSDNKYLLEIKTNKAFPLWLAKLLSENKIYKQSFSKYGNEYIDYCMNKKIINIKEIENQNIKEKVEKENIYTHTNNLKVREKGKKDGRIFKLEYC